MRHIKNRNGLIRRQFCQVAREVSALLFSVLVFDGYRHVLLHPPGKIHEEKSPLERKDIDHTQHNTGNLSIQTTVSGQESSRQGYGWDFEMRLLSCGGTGSDLEIKNNGWT